MSYNHVVHSILRALTEANVNEPEDLFETTEYKEDGFSVIDCPICGKKTMDMYWICIGFVLVAIGNMTSLLIMKMTMSSQIATVQRWVNTKTFTGFFWMF